jgi:hypothetical protein
VISGESSPSGVEPQVPDRLTPDERAARDRRAQRLAHALRNPTRVTNPDAMADAIRDAFPDRPTVGAIRRGDEVLTAVDTFDWHEVRRRVDAQHAADIAAVAGHSQQRREKRPPFSSVSGAQLPARTGNRNTKNRDRAYGIAALDGECWRVARTAPGNRNNTLASASFKVGRVVGAGLLNHDEAYSNLLGAALDCGLSEREARPVIRSGLRAGARKPREVA